MGVITFVTDPSSFLVRDSCDGNKEIVVVGNGMETLALPIIAWVFNLENNLGGNFWKFHNIILKTHGIE